MTGYACISFEATIQHEKPTDSYLDGRRGTTGIDLYQDLLRNCSSVFSLRTGPKGSYSSLSMSLPVSSWKMRL